LTFGRQVATFAQIVPDIPTNFPFRKQNRVTDSASIDAPIPKGVADFLPEQAGAIGFIEEKISRVFELWGFRQIVPPLLEFQDVMAVGLGEELRDKTFRFDDRQTGRLLAIPSDITPQVARIVATRMRGVPLPHRLYYSGRVLRHAEMQTGRSREIFQSGVELIGLDSPEADAEMIAMAIEVMQGLGLENFKIDLGQVEFYRGIMESSGLPQPAQRLLREAISKKDASAVRDILSREQVTDAVREEITALPRLFGGLEVLEEASRVVRNDRSRRALDNLSQVVEILGIHGVNEFLTIDLGEIRGLDYHTGVNFEGFVGGLGEAVCGGGRYDTLTARYGFASPATGFTFYVLSLLHALERRPEVTESLARDFLLFNQREDRSEALALAQTLRRKGYSTARDIIRRDLPSSLDYAKRMHIRYLLVTGGEHCAEDEVYVVRVADRQEIILKKTDLLREDFQFEFVA
jgi:ATP phosphoribosyltransferase regulatory subunit